MITTSTVEEVEAAMRRLATRLTMLKGTPSDEWWRGSRETAAVRRASMDLTRALADLRRGRDS